MLVEIWRRRHPRMAIAQKTPSNRPLTPWERRHAGDNIRAINRVSRLGRQGRRA
jgi:hypothetical protein